ncbi:hypothetical protein WMY93_024234 [Mugilogobius chulae]|uniref:Uncharacterized protein n=1 Tax=Mugilogobius chulae TaxID=88201 RepID=A0AAW0NAZ1_9GOBI
MELNGTLPVRMRREQSTSLRCGTLASALSLKTDALTSLWSPASVQTLPLTPALGALWWMSSPLQDMAHCIIRLFNTFHDIHSTTTWKIITVSSKALGSNFFNNSPVKLPIFWNILDILADSDI